MSGALTIGDTAPRFEAPALNGNPRFVFDTMAGRYMVLLFFASASDPGVAEAVRQAMVRGDLFDDHRASFFGVTTDPEDVKQQRIAPQYPGRRFFLDFDRRISSAYGAAGEDGFRPCWLLLDIGLRVLATAPLDEGRAIFEQVEAFPHPADIDVPAPVITVANILEPPLCRRLIALYREHGGQDSGFMRDVDGKTVGIVDHSHKRRADWVIDNEQLRAGLRARLSRRLVPQIHRAFQFKATRLERYIVACYEGQTGGFFRPHRDNTTRGTAHRRFACTINLNAEEYDGGDLRFPEFGRRTYRAPTGGAVVFSCSLLHEAQPVTKGTRYCFLPFFYDEAAAQLREANSAPSEGAAG